MEESSSFFSHHREKQIKNGKREREKQGSKPTSTVDDRGTLVPLPPPAFPCPPMAWTMQASRCRTISRDFMPRSAKVEASGTPVQRAAPRRHASQFVAVSRRRFRRRRTSVAVEAEAAATSSTSGDTLDLDLPPRLSLSIGEPCFSVSLTYDAAGGPLDGASRVVARVGVAAWQWTRDVELAREREEEEEEEERIGETGGEGGSGGNGGSEAKESPKQQRWSGFVSVPASRLPAPGHLDLQAAFFAPRGAFSDGSEERWDNAGGTNWGAEVFLFYVFFFFFCFEEKQKTHVSLSLSPSLYKKKKKKNFKGVAADVAPVSGNNSEQQQNRLPGLARAPPPAESARAAASLLLRLDALAASRNNNVLLPPGSAPLLRALARAGDGPLLSAYERCRSWTDDAAVASELARAAGLRFSNTSSSSSSSSGRNNNNRPLHVVHVASEAAPFAKVGGLADVVCALSRSNQSGGTHVELVLPKYDCGDYGSLSELRELGRISVPWGGGGSGNGTAKRGVPTAVWGALCSGLPTYLLEPLEPLSPHSSSLPPPFWRGQAYGAPDDAERFLFFAVAALEFLLWAGRSPDAIHCHDWQSASVPLLLEAGGYRRKRAATFGGGLGFFGLGGGGDGGGDQGREGGGVSSSPTAGDGPLATTGTVLTIHNLAFPGRMNPSVLSPAVSGERMERGLEGREKWKRKRESRERERKKKKLNLFFAQKNNSKKQNTNKKTLNHRSSPLGSLEPRVPQLGLRRRPRPGRAQGPPRRARRPAPEGRGGPRGRHDDCLSHLFPRSVV